MIERMRFMMQQKRVIIDFCSVRYFLITHFWVMEQQIQYDSLKAHARYLYVIEHKEEQEIIHETNISAAELRRLIMQESWANQRLGMLTSKQKQLSFIYGLLEKLALKMDKTEDPNVKDVELMNKLTANIRNLDTRTDLGTINEIGQKFCLWLRPRNRDLSMQVCKFFGDFLAEQAKALI